LHPKRIFHGPFNIAGIPGILARAERAAGLKSRAVCFPQGVYQRDVDQLITGFTADFAAEAFASYDIFNFHFGYSLFGDSLNDLPWLKRAGKKIIMHFHGCDIRDSKIVQEKYEVSACQACWPMACNRNRTDARRMAAKYADHVVCYTPDILEFVERSIFVPQPVDVAALTAIAAKRHYAPRDFGPLQVVHAPSATDLKGSAHVEAAVERLRARGVPIELNLVTNRPHAEVIEALLDADLVVDQLLFGAYGVFSVEAMALGRPTACYVREDVRGKYLEAPPLIDASPHTIEGVLEHFALDRSALRGIGAASAQYVLANHSVTAVADRLRSLYK
jgi:glycosyltransferase involved in cell wall biosynthesis